MEYITVKEIAQKWGISERLAQRYCTEGRIEGAEKFNNTWAIPADAEKPEDPRKLAARERTAKLRLKKGDGYIPMPLLNTAYEPGHCMESIVKIEDLDLRNIALAEYYYFSGQAEKCAYLTEKYLDDEDIFLSMSARWLFAYSNLALNKLSCTREAFAKIESELQAIDDKTLPEHRAFTICVVTGAAVLLHLPVDGSLPPLKSLIHLLPPGLRFFALYIQAHQAYLKEAYNESIGIVETALALQTVVYPIPTIYLHLLATMDYMSLKKTKEAKEHLLEAWKLAQPDDLLEGFAEHHGLLAGMLEAVIKKEWPEDFQRIISITYSFASGWRKIHNSDTGEDVADNLTTTEFVTAMLAARGWSNKEIGEHMGVSPHTVKHHVSSVLAKLGLSQRKDLERFMLK